MTYPNDGFAEDVRVGLLELLTEHGENGTLPDRLDGLDPYRSALTGGGLMLSFIDGSQARVIVRAESPDGR